MKQVRNRLRSRRLLIILISVVMLFISFKVRAQELPPRPMNVTVSTSQILNFGAFYIGSSGGTVIIDPGGSRSSTGDIVLLDMGIPFSSALYEVDGNVGTIVSISKGSNAILTGSNGGTLTLQIGDILPSDSFVISVSLPALTQVTIGGILIVGSQLSTPAGSYSGTFDVIFNQE
jgi:hypothetical protein